MIATQRAPYDLCPFRVLFHTLLYRAGFVCPQLNEPAPCPTSTCLSRNMSSAFFASSIDIVKRFLCTAVPIFARSGTRYYRTGFVCQPIGAGSLSLQALAVSGT